MKPGTSLAETATRVRRSTAPAVNERITQQTRESIVRYAGAGPELDRRIAALQREWDVERVIETEAPLTILAGIALGVAVNRRFLLLSAMAAGMLAVHNLQGWYPLLPLLRRLGFRTTQEIADEIYALKAARGDFDHLDQETTHGDRARLAYEAAELPK